MPKVIDKKERQTVIAEAVWNIVNEKGFHQATVRRVAQEAELSVGSLRQSFKSQAELYEYAMNLIIERLTKRIDSAEKSSEGSALQNALNLLVNFLPLEGEQETEMRVWLAFSTEALHSPDLKVLNDSLFDQTRYYVGLILQYLDQEDLLKEEINIQEEVVRLHAILDGLTVHRLTRPEVIDDQIVTETLKQYLAQICLEK